jgi:hypothetical protein
VVAQQSARWETHEVGTHAVSPAFVQQRVSIFRIVEYAANVNSLLRRFKAQVHDTLLDPVLLDVLDPLRQYFSAHLQQSVAVLDEWQPGARRPS